MAAPSQVVMSQLVTAFSKKDKSVLWTNTLAIPAYVAVLSAVALLLHVILVSEPVKNLYRWFFSSTTTSVEVNHAESSATNTTLLDEVKEHVAKHGGKTIFAYKIARLVGCLILLGLSIASAVANERAMGKIWGPTILGKWGKKHRSKKPNPALSVIEWLEIAMCMTFLYASILAVISVSAKPRWGKVVVRHLNALLLATFGVYFYRDLFPLTTFDRVPMDLSEGRLLWAKISILFASSVIIPLTIPRQYVPVDPKNPMKVPNPEQTSSIASFALYAFLDPTVFLAYRIPHLPHDQLPPLADYDYSNHLKDTSFQHIDPFLGSKKRHLFFGLMRIFRVEYTILTLTMIVAVIANFASPIGVNRLLYYLETGGKDSTIKPWLWIIWLFLGPMVASMSFQWYIYIATRTLVRVQCIVTQLVFEHSLRIRVKAETSQSATGTSDAASPVSVASDSVSVEGSNTSDPDAIPSNVAVEGEIHSREDTLQADVSSTKSTTSSKGKQKAKSPQNTETAPEGHSSAENLVGKINNLITTDLENIVESRDFLFVVIYIPLQITLCISFLYIVLGWSAFVGLAVMILLFPMPGYVAKRVQDVQVTRLKKTDARVQTVTETMNVLRMVKLFGWEKKMNERVVGKREEELKWIWKRQLLELVNGSLNYLIPVMTMLATYTTYTVIMKQDLSASKVFSSMSVFDMLRDQLHLAFSAMTQTVTGKVSLDRMNDFLKNTELLDSFQGKDSLDLFTDAETDSDIIGFRDAAFTWSNDVDGSLTPSKRNFTLRVEGELFFKRKCINLIIGPTGSGKTSLLMALLGEMHYIPSGPDSWFNLPRSAGIAYAAQESWVQNETIRENIVFGAPFDEARYKKVIYQCCLERDLELFEAGDKTEVGEKGLTLSGGQKARITLARAVYSRAEIILLDDVLAALDVHTAKWIIDKCFTGDLIQGRTILLVTHNIAMARPIADYVISMNVDGTISSHDSVSEALEKSSDLDKEAVESQQILEKVADEIDAAPLGTESKDGKLIMAEEIEEGHVSWAALKLYFDGLGGGHPLLFFIVCTCSLLLTELSNAAQTWYLGHWASQYESHPSSEVIVSHYLGVYGTLLVVSTIIYCSSFILYMFGMIRASRSLHKQLVESVLGTTLRWLDTTPTSRVIARCTQDIRAVDGPISNGLWWLSEMSTAMVVKFFAVVLFTPIFLGPGVFVAVLGGWCGQVYISAQLSVKREMSNAKAPVLGHFGAAISGLVSIRAYGAQKAFIQVSLDRIDRFTRAARTFYNLNRWICIRIDVIGSLFAASLAAYLVYFKGPSAANTGFSLNMAVGFSGMILWWVRTLNEFEVQGNSLERIQGYISIEQEPKATEKGIPPAYWPASGDIRVENLSAKYSVDGPKVLHNMSFHIKAGERVGVVGRTGSGKSSLTLSLLRCIFTEGNVYYDGMPTNSVNLDALRSNITIIPQIPELLSGTLRQNLDPFDQYDDATLNDALRAAGLFSLQNEMDEGRITLDSSVASGGGNLSIGQRQILALARAIVRGSKLLILDEATSAIDYKTDSVIQSSLRHELGGDVTLITVAHRLQTIMDADKIMVLDAGRIVEFDSPRKLLEMEGGKLRALVDESGDKDALYAMAQGNI